MAYIYRLETADGAQGIYAKCLGVGASDDYNDTPTPNNDRGLCAVWSRMTYDDQQRHFFGFRDVNQLNAWFPDRSQHADYGLVIALYHVDDAFVKKGEKQVIFPMSYATRLDTWHPEAAGA